MKLCLLFFAISMCLWSIDATPTSYRPEIDVAKRSSLDCRDRDLTDKCHDDKVNDRSVDNDRADRDRNDNERAKIYATKRSACSNQRVINMCNQHNNAFIACSLCQETIYGGL